MANLSVDAVASVPRPLSIYRAAAVPIGSPSSVIPLTCHAHGSERLNVFFSTDIFPKRCLGVFFHRENGGQARDESTICKCPINRTVRTSLNV
jgi:hypothetical protein